MRAGRLVALVVAASSIFVSAGCGLLFDPARPEPEQVYGNPQDLEKVNLTVGALRTLDTAPLHLAVSQGLFKQEGLNVTIEYINAGPIGVERLAAQTLDISFTSYPPIYLAEYRGVGKGVGGFRIVADATSLAPRNSVIVVPPDSSIRNVTDLRGATIAVVGINTMAHLLVLNTLAFNDISPDEVTYVPARFEETAGLLVTHSVDAAFLTEPYVTIGMRQSGIHVVDDTYNGANEGVALCGYAASGDWVEQHPKTLAAFSRAMQRATQVARDRPWEVHKILPTYITGLTVDYARIINYTTYEPVLNVPRLQRVATLMQAFGMFGDGVTSEDPWLVKDMIEKHASLTRESAN